MSTPEFDPARLAESQRIVEGYGGDQLAYRAAYESGTFTKALLFGAGAAFVGSLGWALVGLTNFVVGFVAIGVGWLVARAMMTATGGVGGRSYQISACVLTYFGCTLGDAWDALIAVQRHGSLGQSPTAIAIWVGIQALIGPFLDLKSPVNGVLGLVILFVGLRTAWRLAAGSPGFGSAQRK